MLYFNTASPFIHLNTSCWKLFLRVISFQILNLFDRDLEEVEKEYVFRSMKVGGEGFHYSKMARWAADTRRKLEQEVNVSDRQGDLHMILEQISRSIQLVIL